MRNIGLADLKEKGREDGEKAAIQSLFGPPMMKLGNDPDKHDRDWETNIFHVLSF